MSRFLVYRPLDECPSERPGIWIECRTLFASSRASSGRNPGEIRRTVSGSLNTLQGRFAMTPEEKFLFDLHGYLIIKNVLTPDEVARLNALADEKFPPVPGKLDRRTRVSTWSPATTALIDHPKILPYLLTLIDSSFRLD